MGNLTYTQLMDDFSKDKKDENYQRQTYARYDSFGRKYSETNPHTEDKLTQIEVDSSLSADPISYEKNLLWKKPSTKDTINFLLNNLEKGLTINQLLEKFSTLSDPTLPKYLNDIIDVIKTKLALIKNTILLLSMPGICKEDLQNIKETFYRLSKNDLKHIDILTNGKFRELIELINHYNQEFLSSPKTPNLR